MKNKELPITGALLVGALLSACANPSADDAANAECVRAKTAYSMQNQLGWNRTKISEACRNVVTPK